MVKRLSKAAYLRAVESPRPRFHRLALNNGQVALSRRVEGPTYWFERNEVAEDKGTYWRDPGRAEITLFVDGVPSALFYLVGRRLDSCTFAYHLSPSQLAKAVLAMRRARLGRLVGPAARWALAHMPESRRQVLESPLRALGRR